MERNIDDRILAYLEDNDEPVAQSDLIDAVAPQPKNHASYALVLMRLQSLKKRGEIIRPTPEPKWRDL